jgi:hypothetical protein
MIRIRFNGLVMSLSARIPVQASPAASQSAAANTPSDVASSHAWAVLSMLLRRAFDRAQNPCCQRG